MIYIEIFPFVLKTKKLNGAVFGTNEKGMICIEQLLLWNTYQFSAKSTLVKRNLDLVPLTAFYEMNTKGTFKINEIKKSEIHTKSAILVTLKWHLAMKLTYCVFNVFI